MPLHVIYCIHRIITVARRLHLHRDSFVAIENDQIEFVSIDEHVASYDREATAVQELCRKGFTKNTKVLSIPCSSLFHGATIRNGSDIARKRQPNNKPLDATPTTGRPDDHEGLTYDGVNRNGTKEP